MQPLLPVPQGHGRPRRYPLREIMNGIRYVLRYGIPWDAMPKDLPPSSLCYDYWRLLSDGGHLERINHHLEMMDREKDGREASPTLAIIDAQSVKCDAPHGERGYDAAKKSLAASAMSLSIAVGALAGWRRGTADHRSGSRGTSRARVVRPRPRRHRGTGRHDSARGRPGYPAARRGKAISFGMCEEDVREVMRHPVRRHGIRRLDPPARPRRSAPPARLWHVSAQDPLRAR